MFFAMLLIGLLPAAFMFDGSGSSEDDADADHPDAVDQGASAPMTDIGALPEAEASPADEPAAEPDPAALEVPAGEEAATISGFRPGTDTVTLHLVSPDNSVSSTTDADGNACLTIEGDADDCTITFLGLDTVPVADIHISIADPATGTASAFRLADAAAGDLDPDDPEAHDSLVPDATPGLAPADPDQPGTLAGTGEDGPPLDPEPGDLPDELAGDEPDAGLDPDDPDLPDTLADPGEDGPPLDPEPGDLPDELAGGGDGPALDPIDSVFDDLDLARGDGLLDRMLAHDSDAFGPAAGVTPGAETVAGDGDDLLTLAPGTDPGPLTLTSGTPILGGTPDVVDAGAGDDTIGAAGGAYVFGGPGSDRLTDTGSGAALYGGAGADSLGAGPGGGYLDGGAGDDSLTGGAGDDMLEGGAHRGATDASDDDTLAGGAGADTLRGGLGADALHGGEGDDVLDHYGRAEERVAVEIHRFDWHEDGAADTLDGGAGDDLVIFGAGDQATGGAGADNFRLYAGDGAGPAEITDFRIGEDFLRITLDPRVHGTVPDYAVRASADGSDGEVVVDGTLVAVLRGAAAATTEDIYVEVNPDIAA